MSQTQPTNKELSNITTELELVRMAFVSMAQEANDIMLSIEESAVPRQIRVPVLQKNNSGIEVIQIITKKFLPIDKLTGKDIDDNMRKQIHKTAFYRANQIVEQYKKMKKVNPQLGLVRGTEIMEQPNEEKKIRELPPTINYT